MLRIVAVGLVSISGAAGISACGSPRAAGSAHPSTAASAPPATIAGGAEAGLRAAASSMVRASSFSFVATLRVGGKLTTLAGRFQAPDREDITVRAAGSAPAEVLFVGTRSWVREPGGAWGSMLGSAGGATDPRSTFSVLDGAAGVSATEPAGGEVVYSFTLPASAAIQLLHLSTGATGTLAGTVVAKGGIVTGLDLRSAPGNRSVSEQIAYSNVGSAAPVPLPPGA